MGPKNSRVKEEETPYSQNVEKCSKGNTLKYYTTLKGNYKNN